MSEVAETKDDESSPGHQSLIDKMSDADVMSAFEVMLVSRASRLELTFRNLLVALVIDQSFCCQSHVLNMIGLLKH